MKNYLITMAALILLVVAVLFAAKAFIFSEKESAVETKKTQPKNTNSKFQSHPESIPPIYTSLERFTDKPAAKPAKKLAIAKNIKPKFASSTKGTPLPNGPSDLVININDPRIQGIVKASQAQPPWLQQEQKQSPTNQNRPRQRPTNRRWRSARTQK